MQRKEKKDRHQLPKLKRVIKESPKLRKEIAEIRFLQAQSELIFNSAIDDSDVK